MERRALDCEEVILIEGNQAETRPAAGSVCKRCSQRNEKRFHPGDKSISAFKRGLPLDTQQSDLSVSTLRPRHTETITDTSDASRRQGVNSHTANRNSLSFHFSLCCCQGGRWGESDMSSLLQMGVRKKEVTLLTRRREVHRLQMFCFSGLFISD